MAIKQRETKQIRGIEIKLKSTTGNLSICQLADDTTLFLKSKHEITIAMNKNLPIIELLADSTVNVRLQTVVHKQHLLLVLEIVLTFLRF
jgi:hypothetical protein